MYVLRYLPEVRFEDRPHGPTEGRFETWLEAEEARTTRPNPERLEVVER